MIRGIDISDYQGAPDFAKVAAAGIGFVYAQAAYGCQGDYWDDTFKSNHDGARAAGLPFGAYHFLLLHQDPVAQARAFLVETKDRLGTLLPMVDVEGDSGDLGSPAKNVEALAAFNRVVEAAIGKRIVIYTGPSYWNTTFGGSDAFAGHPLWVANYGATVPEIPNGWNTWTLWQYTSGLVVDGIKGFVDADYFNGSSLEAIVQ